jgi:hypothetical protein
MFVEATDEHAYVPKAMQEAWDLRHLASVTNWETQLVFHDLRYLACAVNWEAQLDSCDLDPCPEMVFDDQATTKSCCGFLWCICLDPTISWKVNDFLCLIWLRCKVLHFMFELADACIFATAFNSAFVELLVEVTDSNANDAKAWCETFFVEDTWTFTAT